MLKTLLALLLWLAVCVALTLGGGYLLEGRPLLAGAWGIFVGCALTVGGFLIIVRGRL